MKQLPHIRPAVARRGEEGYTLVAVMFLLFLFTLSMTVAAPQLIRQIQRDREVETMQRGKQYIQALRLYYTKFGSYPPTLDALTKTNNIRFLRKKYIDPTSGKEEWKPVRFGQNKAPIAMGFFGKPLTSSTLAGTGPSGGNGVNGATSIGAPATGDTGSTGATGSTGSTGSTDSGLGGQTFGGGGIIGFSPNGTGKSILVYKTKDHYNEWEFVYDKIMDQKMMTEAGTIGASGSTGSTGSIGVTGSTGSTGALQ